MKDWLAVLIGGMVGGGLRYELSQWWGSIPATTMVNLVGSLALAWLTTALINCHSAPQWLNLGIGTGMIGAFTTFSSLMMNAVISGQQSALYGLIIIFINMVGGLICAGCGYWLGGHHVVSR
ncbi:fluoride efflux transporter FluC [Limosilactobacillus gastricus]|uniref:fluoride efflux transporter FluC n=1 Tax=Limosilactobacillus gastricus TaxID=227942 RepID=UPI0002F3DCC2|nr:CrcB family protein [Limosilactobacillus gastricus]